MIEIKEDLANRKSFVKLETIDNDILYGIQQAFYDVGVILDEDLSANLKRGTRTGRVYKYKGRNLTASSEGEYPQRRSGLLRDAVFQKVLKSDLQLWFGITDKAPYAKFLEDNEEDEGVQGRLLVKHTVEKNKAQTDNIIRSRLDAAIKR